MSETHFPPATSDLDASFVFEGAYRPRASLSLAERAAFGLHDDAMFAEHMRRLSDGPSLPIPLPGITSKAQCPAQLASAKSASSKGRNRAEPHVVFPTDKWRRGTRLRLSGSSAPKRACKQLPVRFTLRHGSLVLSGVIFDERIVALIRIRKGAARQ